MRIGRALGALVVALGIVAGIGGTAHAAVPAPTYYLSLGDSLAAGYQPAHDGIPAGDSTRGYTDVLYQRLAAQEPGLEKVNLGCSGETTTTMLEGGRCEYDAGSQLAAAQEFLREHPGQVTHITLTIGANDVQRCARGGSIDYGCVFTGLGTVAQNVPAILAGLRQAGGLVQITGANYYNPFLSFWNSPSPTGKLLTLASSALQVILNGILSTAYGVFGAGVADVAGTYRSLEYLPFVETPPYGAVPANVATICTFTFICDLDDIHATDAGYVLIADAYSRALGVPTTAG